MYYSNYESILGEMILITDGAFLKGLYFIDQKYYLESISEPLERNDELKIIIDTKKWLGDYFNQVNPNPNLIKIDPDGSIFQKRVWKILTSIPYSKKVTYSEIAKIIGNEMGIDKMSPQAIGNAISHNHISIIIPCHRVIGKDGKLTGYAGGIERKRRLLEMEEISPVTGDENE